MRLKESTLLQTRAFIGGLWVDSLSSEKFNVCDPASGEILASVAKCDERDAVEAVEAAAAALPIWQAKSPKERAAIMLRWSALIEAHIDDLAAICTAEQGKPLAESRGEILHGASYIDWFAAEGQRVYGDVNTGPTDDMRVVCIKQSVGVVACITPWNFPSAMLTRKLSAALAAGSTIICKPATQTPLSALALCELARRAGIPDGVINVVQGNANQLGAVMTSHPLIRKVTFTGSTAVGKQIQRDSASTVKRLSLELGGNAPFIIFDDVDLDVAVQGAIISKFRNAGQTCVCANRILVQDTIYNEFLDRFAVAADALSVGAGGDEGVEMGPLVSAAAVQNTRNFLDDALRNGAKIRTRRDPFCHQPNFFNPVVLSNVDRSMRVFREEIFGPLAPVLPFRSEQEAVDMANDTEYGLASYLYTRDIGRVWRVCEALDFGMVGLNSPILSNETAPFGGVKQSGQGREGSRYGLDDYLEIKYICMGGIEASESKGSLSTH